MATQPSLASMLTQTATVSLTHWSSCAAPNQTYPIPHPAYALATTEHSGKTYMTYEIDVDASLDSALYFYFQNGNDLQNWDTPDNTPQLIGSNASYNTYRVRDNLPLDEAPHRFIKVSVSPLGGGEGSGLENQP